MSEVSTTSIPSPWVSQMAQIRSIKSEVPQVTTYALEFEDPAVRDSYRFQPGQFNMLYLPGIGEAAISISSDPQLHHRLLHTVRVAGNVTCALARLSVGDQIGVRGPFGSSWPVRQSIGRDLVIACGGIGLPPLRPVIYQLVNHRYEFGRVVLLYGARTPADLLFTEEFERWREADIQVEVTVDLGDQDWNGNIGVVPALLNQINLIPERTCLMTCGPEMMMRYVIFEALSRGIESRHIFLSMERSMNCAIGLCGHCQLGPSFVCKDGPVFNYQLMEPYLHMEDF